MTHVFRLYVPPVLLLEQLGPVPREDSEPPEQRRGQPPPLMAVSPNSSGIKENICLIIWF